MSKKGILYYPCVYNNKRARIDHVVGKAMSKEDAENFLKTHFQFAWSRCDAIPQPVDFIDNPERLEIQKRNRASFLSNNFSPFRGFPAY